MLWPCTKFSSPLQNHLPFTSKTGWQSSKPSLTSPAWGRAPIALPMHTSIFTSWFPRSVVSTGRAVWHSDTVCDWMLIPVIPSISLLDPINDPDLGLWAAWEGGHVTFLREWLITPQQRHWAPAQVLRCSSALLFLILGRGRKKKMPRAEPSQSGR